MAARHKIDWAGINLGDAFRAHLEHDRRLPALRLFYRLCGEAQREAARLAAVASEDVAFEAEAKPQLAPCYTDHPAGPAAMAAIGLSALVEYGARVDGLAEGLKGAALRYLVNRGTRDEVLGVRALVDVAAEAVAGRIMIELLRRSAAAAAVEHYRLFLCARQTGAFENVAEIVYAVALFGDLLPPGAELARHPTARQLLGQLSAKSEIYLRLVAAAPDDELETLAVEWTLVLCEALASIYSERTPAKPGAFDDRVAPLATPRPPVLGASDADTAMEALARGFEAASQEAQETAEACAEALARAVAAACPDEPRPDLVEALLRARPFQATPFEGEPLSGREVSAMQEGRDAVTGYLVDRALRPSDDLPAVERLVAEAAPLTAALRRALYPSTSNLPLEERYRPSGGLDPRRMFLHEVSAAVFRRYRTQEVSDRRGRAVLAIACDGSGSLERDQIHMTKLLAGAWLQATARSQVEVLAGVYCGEAHRDVGNVPLVEWIHHPRKTLATSRREAVRVLPSVSSEGRGAQADVLSLAFILDEARALALARGQTVYLVVVSDCRWNASSSGGEGLDEMDAFLAAARTDADARLHVTLVGLAPPKGATLDHRVDMVVKVSKAEMGDPGAVARRVSDYVASCMRERRRARGRR